SMNRIAPRAEPGSDAASVMSVMLRKITGFSGLVHENMYRAAGWQFLTIGRSMERAAMMTDLLAAVADPKSPDGGLDLAIEVGDSIMVHRQRYAVLTNRENVVDLLGLDPTNPRSVRFHLAILGKWVEVLYGTRPENQTRKFERKVVALQEAFKAHTVYTLDTQALMKAHWQILDLSTVLNATFIL
ncbi:MAG: alpha-E domain-containing protein, partial [Candidatus Saccharibacteria bacterium]|nr:alpha-E domain-containing protein [Pseudorhodobacter sp.]